MHLVSCYYSGKFNFPFIILLLTIPFHRSSGSVILVKDGCRNRDFATIIPHQPARYRERKNEVFLDFEAFLLSSMRERSTLWIHSQIKACMEPQDCQPVRNDENKTPSRLMIETIAKEHS